MKDTTDIYHIGENTIRVAVSGIGLKKARRATKQMCTGSLGFLPDLVINAGFCGAVRSEMVIGHLILANRLAYRERELELKNSPTEKVSGLLAESKYRVGKLQTFNWPVLSRTRVSDDTLAVDMESFAIAEITAKYQIPAIFIKAVSDIVPRHAGPIRMMKLVRSLMVNSRKARACLSFNVNKICSVNLLPSTP